LDNKFNVIYTGLQEGIAVEDFVSKFCSKFGVSEQKAQQIVNSSSDVVVKKEQGEKKAAQYRAAFESCGMIIRLDEIIEEAEVTSGLSLAPMGDEVINEDAAAINTNAIEANKPRCPKCGSDQIEGDECQACGIYISKYLQSQQNRAVIHEEERVDDEPTEQFDSKSVTNPYTPPEADLSDPADYDLEPEKVSLGRGIHWLGRGFWHFKQNPLAWIGSIIVFIILSMLLAFIPFAGVLAINLFTPVIMAGFILGSHEQHEGGDFRVGHLFAGFSSNVGQLVLVGVIYLLGILLIGGSFGIIMGGTIAATGMVDPNMGPQALMSLMGPGMIIMMLVALVLLTLLAMAYYYAPALIAIDDLSAMKAMKLSMKACLKNWLTFIIYGLVVIVLFFIAAIPVFLGYLIAIPMLQASIYVSYRDIFHHE